MQSRLDTAQPLHAIGQHGEEGDNPGNNDQRPIDMVEAIVII